MLTKCSISGTNDILGTTNRCGPAAMDCANDVTADKSTTVENRAMRMVNGTGTGHVRDVTGASSAGHFDRLSESCGLRSSGERTKMWRMDQRKPVLQFGEFKADLESGELYRDGLRVALQQQPFRVLAILLTKPGELVTREELRRAIWADGTFVAFERGLTSAVRKVREALGDHAAAPAFIETLPGRGYRFIAPVTDVSRKTGAVDNESPTSGFSVFHSRWRAQAAVIALMAVLEGGIGPGTYAIERLAAAEALSEYACLLKAQGRFEDGLAAIAKAHAIAPEHAKFTAELGLHLHAARRYEAELPMLLRAVEQDRGSADAWLHLGLGYARRAQFDSAIPALERAVRVSNGDGRASSWLEWARHQQGVSGS